MSEKNGQKHISYTEFSKWQLCPYLHDKIYVKKFREEPSLYMSFGSTIHKILEEQVQIDINNKESKISEEKFLKYFEEYLKKDKVIVNHKNDKLYNDMLDQGAGLIKENAYEYIKALFPEEKIAIFSTEEELMEDIEGTDYKFKGFIDLVLKLGDDKYVILDWKTCSWGWDARKKNDKLLTYQLSLYKYFFAKKHDIPPENIETYFGLLKRTAKKNRIEIFRVTSGNKKLANAVELLYDTIKGIEANIRLKKYENCNKCFQDKFTC